MAGTGRALAEADEPVSRRTLVQAAERTTVEHTNPRDVWFRNSIRGAIGLAIAVYVAQRLGVQNAFWIGLGALSVLRSNALATGATVVRALGGTVVGFAIGAAIVSVLGTSHALLWTLFPVVVLVAGAAPAVISFAAGQAAFTVFSIILFNIIVPAGWRVGVLRIEDVAIGCVASLVAGVLFWPRGAGALLRREPRRLVRPQRRLRRRGRAWISLPAETERDPSRRPPPRLRTASTTPTASPWPSARPGSTVPRAWRRSSPGRRASAGRRNRSRRSPR